MQRILRDCRCLARISRTKLVQPYLNRVVSQCRLAPCIADLCNFTLAVSHPRVRYYSSNASSLENEVDAIIYDKVCNETLESLCEYFEELVEKNTHLKETDVIYGDGVLTVQFGSPYGTYVINRQSPNKQIWLSSPTSGPKRYDFISEGDGHWIYKHDGVTLHQLLQTEIPKIVSSEVDFSRCSHSFLQAMEVMEEGNLMDRVPILLQRDFQYYEKNQIVLTETICPGVVGGRLDFPRNASFAAVKLVMWWEEEFVAAFRMGSGLFSGSDSVSDNSFGGCGGIVKASDPDKFVNMTVKSADLLLDHLHILAQEALDHADLPVLTATLGAAALVKNSLHCYIQASQHGSSAERTSALQASQKRFAAMSEAVAERLLDLHVRLLSLYLLQDAGGRPLDSTEAQAPEGGSPSVNGWWLYMQGTRQDLWDTVPPKMAQRIFAGMLNETLSILTVRYTQSAPSFSMAPLLVNDILNILLCTSRLLSSMCSRGSELTGMNATGSSIARDILDVHSKCAELFRCLVLRGAPLHNLYKVFKQPSSDLFDIQHNGASPWYTFSCPSLFPPNSPDNNVKSFKEMSTPTAIVLELDVLLAQPQPVWPLLLKVLLMRDCALARIIMTKCLLRRNLSESQPAQLFAENLSVPDKCDGFLCTLEGSCVRRKDNSDDGCDTIAALTYIIMSVCSKKQIKSVLISALEATGTTWADCLDRRQVWSISNDVLTAWRRGAGGSIRRLTPSLATSALAAAKAGASTYQTMSVVIRAGAGIWSAGCGSGARSLLSTLQESLPASCVSLGQSPALQILAQHTYAQLQLLAEQNPLTNESAHLNGQVVTDVKDKAISKKSSRKKTMKKTKAQSVSFDGSATSANSLALALAEALCSIDEDNKHTEQINEFISQIDVTPDMRAIEKEFELPHVSRNIDDPIATVEQEPGSELLVTQLLMTNEGRDSLRAIYEHITRNADTLMAELGVKHHSVKPFSSAPLLYIMFHIADRPFDQFLTGEWKCDWSHLLTSPLGLSKSCVKYQLSRRPEFQPNAIMTPADQLMVNTINQNLK